VLRYRELLGDQLLDWAGPDESRFEPPKKRSGEEYMSRATAILSDCGWSSADVEDAYFRPVQPDALLDVAIANRDARVLVEYDRTRRVDKNYDKFLRYETLLVVWWRATHLGCPYAVFVCQDAEHRRRFMYAADGELTGHLSAHTERGHEERYTARDRTLFVIESDIRNGETTALALPALPLRHEQRTNPATVPTSPYPASRTEINAVPSGLFPPMRSLLGVRSERNTRPKRAGGRTRTRRVRNGSEWTGGR